MKKIFTLKRVVGVILIGLFIGVGVLYYIGDKYNQGERNALSLMKDKLTNTQKEPVNLIICWTPLQMLIAEKIIEQNPNEKFYSVLISQTKNNVFEYYFNRLKNKSERAYSFYITPKSKYSSFYQLLELKIKGLLLPKIKTIYVASIDNYNVRTFISPHTSSSRVKTFDDGTINLVENSIYLSNEERISNKLLAKFHKILNPDLTIPKLRNSSDEHFTIFSNLPNIMGGGGRKMTYIPLYENLNIHDNKSIIKDTITILLGMPEKDMKPTLEKAIKQFNIKYTSKHPRQTYELNNAITIKSNLILEDYLLQETKKNPHTLYHIYTFFSTAGLTVKDFPNVKVTTIKPKSLPQDFWLMPVHQLFEKAGIPIKTLND